MSTANFTKYFCGLTAFCFFIKAYMAWKEGMISIGANYINQPVVNSCITYLFYGLIFLIIALNAKNIKDEDWAVRHFEVKILLKIPMLFEVCHFKTLLIRQRTQELLKLKRSLSAILTIWKKSTMDNKDFNLVIICGAPASGKMIVGQEVQKLTDYDYWLRPFRA